VWCVAAGGARLLGRRLGSTLASSCGAVILSYFLVSVLLYRQYPGGNYAPLHDVLGVAMAAGTVDLARAARRVLDHRGLGGPRATALAATGVLLLGAGSLWNVLRRGDPAAHVAVSFNAVAERDAAAYLRAAPDGDLTILTTTYNLAGVFEALGHGRLRVVQAHEHLERCAGAGGAVDECLVGRWTWILGHGRALPLRVIVPIAVAAVDHPAEVIARLAPTLAAASARLGLAVRLERRFATAAGAPVLAVYRVDGTPRPITWALAGRPAPTGACATGIGPDLARRVFAALRAADPTDGCSLADVDTERASMRVRWAKDGRAIEPAVLVPAPCATAEAVRGPQLAMAAPPSLAAACPGALARLRALVERGVGGVPDGP
jgi:hypothetical protein